MPPITSHLEPVNKFNTVLVLDEGFADRLSYAISWVRCRLRDSESLSDPEVRENMLAVLGEVERAIDSAEVKE